MKPIKKQLEMKETRSNTQNDKRWD